MAAKKVDGIELTQPRLKELKVQNFRCIGHTPVIIELDEIVVLVGPNNSGKSSILRAYEVVMSHGSAAGKLAIEDFPNGQIDIDNLPAIELKTIVGDNSPGDDWVRTNEDGEIEVRERWFWEKVGAPTRQGWNVKTADWDKKVPWGAPNIAKSRRPEPHRVSAFDSPEKQSTEITKILLAALQDRINTLADEGAEAEETPYMKLLDAVKTIQKAVVEETKEEIGKVETELRKSLQDIFPDHDVQFDAKPEEDVEKTIKLFGNNPELKMGLKNGYMCSIERQGSGARRTLLWTALKIVSERKRKEKDANRPHVLLLDEPEICLHPTAIRDACDVLYGLPVTGNWQVMVTTHSPCFIDVSRDNTTIVRVERKDSGDIVGTTIFRPERANLDEDDRKRLKLLNLCDPYMAEFFFGGRTILVEGDTEYTAFQYLREAFPEDFKDIHIIRARGKATIVSLMKILNHFGAPYAALHDTDRKIAVRKGEEISNPAWSLNAKILAEAKNSEHDVRLVASVPNFEGAYYDEQLKGDKPYTALAKLKTVGEFRDRIEKLLRALIDPAKPLPENAIAWSTEEELDALEV